MFSDLTDEKKTLIQELSDNQNVGTIGGYCEDGFPIYYANKKIANMMGYDTVEELVQGIHGFVSNTIHPDDMSQVILDLNGGHFYDGMTYKTMYRMPRKDGSWFWTIDRGKVFRTEDGRLAILSICNDMTEFVERQTELEQQNTLSKITLNHMPGAYHQCSIEEGFPFIFISDRFLELLGWTREEIQTKFHDRFIEMLHPDDREIIEEFVLKIEKNYGTKKISDAIYRLRGKNGYLWVSDATSLVKVGNKVFYQGTLTNITNFVDVKEKREKQLKQSYRKLEEMQSIISASNMGTWQIKLIDGEKPTMLADERMLELIDLKNKECTPEDIYNVWFNNIVPEAMPSVLESIEAMKNGKKYENTYLWNHPTLGERYVRCGGTALELENGYILRGYHYDVDDIVREQISQQKLLEETLLKEKKHLEVISSLSTIYTTIFLVNLITHEYKVLNSVPLMGKVAGVTGNFDDVKENIFKAFITEDEQESMRSFLNFDTLTSRLQNKNTIVNEYKNPQGRWFQARIIVNTRNDEGVVQDVVYVARDFTDEKRREIELQEKLRLSALQAKKASSLKTDFLKRMSHDIRTPLNGIIGMLSIYDRYKDDPVKQKECEEKILHSADYLLDLVNNVLDISKVETGTIQLDNKPFDLCEILLKMVSAVEASASEYGIDIRGGKEASHLIHRKVIGSSTYMNRVLMNLASNAIKYNKKGGYVNLYCNELYSDDEYATYEFVCEDNGLGMSAEFQKHAFEPYAQENKQTATGFSGSGLGLAIVKEIIDKMNGNIKLESKENVGTKFTITIPLLLDHSELKDVNLTEKQMKYDFFGCKALLVEDNQLNMEIAKFMLEEEGIVVTEAKNGKEAVEIVKNSKSNTFDFIFMDVMMPIMDGFEATKQIRALEREDTKTIPIIAMTANAFNDDKQECLNAGMNAHIAKPINVQSLKEMMISFMKK